MSSAPTPEQLRPLLNSENFGDRIKGINLLRDIEPATAFKLIQPLCQDSNTRVRYAAVSQLSTLGEQDPTVALNLLKSAIVDPEPDVQAAAADSLGALKLTEAFSDLQTLYQNTSEWLVQMSVVACLGEMGDPRAFDLLQTALEEGNSLVSVSAMGALGELQDERAIPLLLPYVDNDDWQVRHRLAQALGHFAQHPDAIAALQTLANDKSDLVAETAKSHQTSE
ncbi:PBS lyase HEAT-like repeat domain protein [Synechococcus sp. PCC 7335]|uniref:phycobilisome degradation protein NblB n=1 Tax=Synechococcus sp. (strain ATCC 29403 / PCC 7335) TaxID=91464 RepID=UPI00017EC038|nr:HEAT repeat domain-containing protein [Synechococcus sp. PCC 7335]EDX87882.1 PBS lyase HEAT-like repeat domain protein [Synechococcus sp. PCC 7335]